MLIHDTSVSFFLLALIDRAFWRRWSVIVQADVTHGIFERLKVRAFLAPSPSSLPLLLIHAFPASFSLFLAYCFPLRRRHAISVMRRSVRDLMPSLCLARTSNSNGTSSQKCKGEEAGKNKEEKGGEKGADNEKGAGMHSLLNILF